MTRGVQIELCGITKRFGYKVVLDDLSLAVEHGELLALLGPSGCGKTTALRIIAGFERADAGSVVIDGSDISDLKPNKRDVGFVFQAYSLFPHLTAFENVAFGLRVRHVPLGDRRTRVMKLLEMVGLADQRDKYPDQMSGGQQQRVALARAIATEPQVLLLDEPLSALDSQVRVQLREEIRRIQFSMGTTTVLVTHDQEEALTMADRVAVMREGKIEQVGTPDDIYRMPLNPFVSKFVGVSNSIPVRPGGTGRVVVFGSEVDIIGDTQVEDGRSRALIRPEDIEVVPSESGDGIIISTLLRGPVTSLNVVVPDLADPIRVDLPTGAESHLPAGQPVALRLRAPAVLLDTEFPETETIGAPA